MRRSFEPDVAAEVTYSELMLGRLRDPVLRWVSSSSAGLEPTVLECRRESARKSPRLWNPHRTSILSSYGQFPERMRPKAVTCTSVIRRWLPRSRRP